MWLKPLLVPIAVKLDDWVGNGRRNPAKKWWLDLEIVDGACIAPKGTNERELDLSHRIDPAKQNMAVYPASMMPVPNDNSPQAVDRKAALAALAMMETPAQARSRKARGGAMPLHYIPTPPKAGVTPGKKPELANYVGVR